MIRILLSLLVAVLPHTMAFAAESATPKVLMVMTSHSELYGTGRKTGVWFEELATPYYIFRDAGFEIVLSSVRGGKPPIDPESEKSPPESVKRFLADKQAVDALANTVPVGRANPEAYDAVFLAGGHGTMWDFADNPVLSRTVQAFVDADKPIAAVCHGPEGLLELRAKDGGYFLTGRKVTAFTRAEEEAVKLDQVVPHYLDAQMKSVRADFRSAPPFKPNVVQDGKLITGQNPASAEGVAKALVKLLKQAKE